MEQPLWLSQAAFPGAAAAHSEVEARATQLLLRAFLLLPNTCRRSWGVNGALLWVMLHAEAACRVVLAGGKQPLLCGRWQLPAAFAVDACY
jgi:hypothetical protein